MRIATWNVNGLRARLDFILHWLNSRQPDVLGMQELKVEDHEFPHDVFEDAGYQVATFGQKGWNGVAIATKAPLEVQQHGLPGQDDAGARLIRGRVGDLSFATVYCPNGKTLDHADFAMKLAWYDALIDYLGELDADQPFVLGGDFNVVPKPLDCWRGEEADGTIFCTAQERSRYQALLNGGLVDLFRAVRPDDQRFSWWDYRGGAFHRGLGLRHRHAARHPGGGRTAAERGDRPRLSAQEERPHRLRPCARLRGLGRLTILTTAALRGPCQHAGAAACR